MKLLFDQNLSPALVRRLNDVFPDSVHVSTIDLGTASDNDVWSYARDNDFVIVTKDADFNDMSIVMGFPPKIVWLNIGNCTTNQVEAALRDNQLAIESLASDSGIGTLIVR